MSSFSLPSDKFYFRDKTTEEPLDLWTPYAGRADEATSAAGALKETLDTLTTSVTNLEGSLDTLNKYLNIQNYSIYDDNNMRFINADVSSFWQTIDRHGLYEININAENGNLQYRAIFCHDGQSFTNRVVTANSTGAILYLVSYSFVHGAQGGSVFSVSLRNISSGTVIPIDRYVTITLHQILDFGSAN